MAVATFQDNLRGQVWFTPQETGPTIVSGWVEGIFPAGKHGMHIHTYGNLSDTPTVGTKAQAHCESAGGHWNPKRLFHGSRTDMNSHAGDLGNIVSDRAGNASFIFLAPKVALTGEDSVVGRSLVVHVLEDDLGKGNWPDSCTTGHSGARLGCAVIGHAAVKDTGPSGKHLGTSSTGHAEFFDFGRESGPDSLTTGHSGKRLGCAVIGHADVEGGTGGFVVEPDHNTFSWWVPSPMTGGAQEFWWRHRYPGAF